MLAEAAEEALASVGLAEKVGRQAAVLSHGERRQLELAMVLVGRPRILLLDEPFAGMSQSETAGMVERLRTVRSRYAILLIEHDLGAVFSLAEKRAPLRSPARTARRTSSAPPTRTIRTPRSWVST